MRNAQGIRHARNHRVHLNTVALRKPFHVLAAETEAICKADPCFVINERQLFEHPVSCAAPEWRFRNIHRALVGRALMRAHVHPALTNRMVASYVTY